MRSLSLVTILTLVLAGCANTQNPFAELSPAKSTSDPDRPSIPKSKVNTGVKLARIQEREGHLYKALEIYNDLYRADPKNQEVCHRLMIVHSRLDQHQEADDFFQKADKLKKGSAALYADYGYACHLRGDLELAETWLKKAHQIRPSEDRITGNLALVLAMQGREQESLAYYRQFLDEAEAQANLGYALTQRGDFAAAGERYAKALELAPNMKSAQNALLQLAEWEHAKQRAQTKSNQSAHGNESPKPRQSSNRPVAPGTASIRS
jgi:Flp pilus assembly protein TadD